LKNVDIDNHSTLIKNNVITLKDINFENNYDGPYYNYQDLIWYNYSHTMKIYTLKQGYNGSINDERTKTLIDELDNQMLCNKFLTPELLNGLTLKKNIKIRTNEHYKYYYNNEPINLFINIGYEKIYNVKNSDTAGCNMFLKVDQNTAELIQLYIDKFLIGKEYNSQMLKNNKIFIQVKDVKLINIINNVDVNKVKLICQLKHKNWFGGDHLKFVLSDIK
jgi:hypothetical protein